MPRDAEFMGLLKFEKAFLFAARNFLRCRLILMGGQVDDERCDTPQAMEGTLLGMLDWKGEMRLLCQEAMGKRPLVTVWHPPGRPTVEKCISRHLPA